MEADSHFSKHVTLAAKGIAILLMLFHHLFYDAPGFVDQYAVSAVPLSWPALNSLSYYAKLCVSVFVFLTGYGMAIRMSSQDNRHRERYAVSRFLKLESSIVFLYLFSLLTAVLDPSRILAYFQEGHLKGIWMMLLDALGLGKFFDTVMFNNSWWYLSFAIFLIFLMPVALKLCEQFGICSVVLAGMVTTFGLDQSRAFSLYLFTFFLGIFLARASLISRIRAYCQSRRHAAALLALFAALFAACSFIRIRWGFYLWMNGLCSLFLVLMLFVLIDLLHLRLRLLELFGRYSMIMYMTHTLIYHHYFTRLVYAPKNWFFIFLWLSLLSLALAAALSLVRSLLHWDSLRLWHLADE